MRIIELNNRIAMRHRQMGWAHTSEKEKENLIKNQLKDFDELKNEINKLEQHYGNNI